MYLITDEVNQYRTVRKPISLMYQFILNAMCIAYSQLNFHRKNIEIQCTIIDHNRLTCFKIFSVKVENACSCIYSRN